MERIKKNLVANFLSNAWMPLAALVAMPFYKELMGLEAVGLLTVFAMLQALSVPLDAGLSMTLSRELARLSVLESSAQQMRDLLRTLEVLFWAMALVIVVVVAAVAPLIAHWWITADQLSARTITEAIWLMALALGLQWPFALYQGGLMGLQHQVALGVINIVMATLRFLGAVVVLWLVSPTVQCFFLYQAIISAAHSLTVGLWLWRSVPRTGVQPVFRRKLLKSTWHFAAGVGGITVAGLIISQMDKIIVSKIFRLEDLAVYGIATMAASAVYRVSAPVFTALQPRFTQLISLGSWDELSGLYHRGCQLISVLVFPLAVVGVLFSREILSLWWYRDPELVERMWLAMSLLIAGTALNGLVTLPYALQLAYGWTKLAFVTTVAAIFVMLPVMLILTKYYGMAGAAAAWMIPYVGQMMIAVPIMHRRLLQGQKWRWYGRDIAAPLAAALLVGVVGRAIIPSGLSAPLSLAGLLAVTAACLLACTLAAAQVRGWLLRSLAGRGRS